MDAMNDASTRHVSHSQLKEWFQKYISPNLKDVSELGSGVEFCLGTFILFPNTISLKKIRIGGLSQYDKYHNFKCLQAAFNDLDLNKVIPMSDMMKMNFKDNFYFGRWFKTFFEANYDGGSYNVMLLYSQCRLKRTKIICNCIPPRWKCDRHTGEFNEQANGSYLQNNEVSVKLTPGSIFVGRAKRQILGPDIGCRHKSSTGRMSSLGRLEHISDSKSLKEILACKSDIDFAPRKLTYPALTDGSSSQTDMYKSLNIAMYQIRKALNKIRAGKYQHFAEDMDKRRRDRSPL